VVDVFTKHDHIVVAVGPFQNIGYSLGDHLRSLVENQRTVEVLLVADAIFDLVAEVIVFAFFGTPSGPVFVEVDADDGIGSEEAVLNPLFERVGVDRIPGLFTLPVKDAKCFSEFANGPDCCVSRPKTESRTYWTLP